MNSLSPIMAASRRRLPLSLSPALWLSDTGSSAGTWPDLSGNGRNAVQATGANQPAIITNAINGRQVRRFDGTNDFYASVWSSVAMPITTTFVVFKWNGGGGGADGRRFLVESRSASSNVFRPSLSIVSGVSPQKIRSFHDEIPGSTFVESTRSVGLSTTLLTASNSGGSSIFINGAAEGTVSGGITTTAITGVNIGTYRSADNRWFSGDIAELIIYPTALSTANRQAVEAYLNAKWAIY